MRLLRLTSKRKHGKREQFLRENVEGVQRAEAAQEKQAQVSQVWAEKVRQNADARDEQALVSQEWADEVRKDGEAKAAKMEQDRQDQYRSWLRNIRMPGFLQNLHPFSFEHLVCNLFRRMGFEVEHTPKTGDSGVDGYLRKQDELRVLQCKRVKKKIGEPVLRDLFGTMQHVKAVQGILVTTGHVSHKARRWAKGKPIRMIELEELVALIRQHFAEDEVVPPDFNPPTSPDSPSGLPK